MEDTGVSVRAFAREIGKTHAWVLRLIKAGIVPRNEDGTIPLARGLEAYNAHQAEKEKEHHVKKEEHRDPSDAVNLNVAMNKAKLAEKTYQARLRELEYKLKAGELLEKKAVADEAEWLAEQIRSKLLAIPPRISSICEGRTARDIEEIIEDAINDAMKELQHCKYR